MKKLSTYRASGLFALIAAFALAACALAFPAAALAEETGIAHTVDSNGMRHYYNSVSEAISAGYGSTVYMDADWNLGSGSIDIADSKSITIQTAGHKITSSNRDATIYVNEHASVTITSYEDAKEYAYRGYAKKNEGDIKSDEWDWRDLTITTSGLITNTNENLGRGIHLEKDAKLTLENVAIAGCGNTGLYMKEGSVANLTNASVCHSRGNRDGSDASLGGGVRMYDSCTLNLNASHIDGNYVYGNGGGVYANSGAHIYLENGSTISGNGARKAGGGIYVNQSFFTIKSADGTGAMAGNASYVIAGEGEKKDRNGGAIHIDGSSGNNEGLIEGIAIKGNYSNSQAGGIFLDQRWTTVRNCVIADNLAEYDGGGARVNGDNVTFENCTVTGNVCDLTGNDRMGGGIEVDYDHDVTLRGICIVKGNVRDGDGKADDIYLDSFISRAYIKGSLDQGSSVGVRTDHSGDLRVAKSFSCSTKDGLFSDESGYYISYGTDEGGDAWQRHASKEFAVKVNGNVVGKYRYGSAVTVEAPAAEAGKVFKGWSSEESTGLYPFADYVKNATSSTLTFEMPQNDVNLVVSYADAKPAVTSVEGVAVKVAATESEQALRDLLPATAQATTDAGTTVILKVKKDGFDLGSLVVDGHVAPPAGGDTATLEIPVESADGSVTVPEGTVVKVTVKVTGNGDGDGPEVPAFIDVDYSQWYADGVAFCSGNGLMTGYDGDDAGMFGVGRTLTRAELAAILWRVADPEAAQAYACDASNATGMADVAGGAWYTGAANWAVEAGVVNGFDEGDHREFRPDAPVTAEQLAAILANYADPAGAAFADLGVLAGFADADAISDWARASVAWAKTNEVVNGYDAGYYRLLMPGEEIPRERVATILMNAFEGGVLQ